MQLLEVWHQWCIVSNPSCTDMVDKGLHSTPQALQMPTAVVTNLPLSWQKKTQRQKCKYYVNRKEKEIKSTFRTFISIYLSI